MDVSAVPIVNGVLPKPEGGTLQGVFLDPYFAKTIISAGVGGHIFIFPMSPEDNNFYPVGILARIEDIWSDTISPYSDEKHLFAKVIGRELCKAMSFDMEDSKFLAKGLEILDIENLRYRGYPLICGAGWHPTGGYTVFDSNRKGVRITIYGFDFETGEDVYIEGYIDDEIEPEKAHTVEHAIIRSLKNYSLCTPKTLRKCMIQETEELKWSLEIGIAKRLPEVFGVTRSGICGNPLTQMASYYLGEEFKNRLKKGEDLVESIEKARTKTVSKLTKEMDISTQRGKRSVQGLKKGMFHDDTPEELKKLKNILLKFPQDPWS